MTTRCRFITLAGARAPLFPDSSSPSIVAQCLGVLLLLFLPSTVRAAIPSLTWEAPEAVDAPVADVSSSSGCSVQHNPGWHPAQFPDEWYVVYGRDGNVYYTTRGISGWSMPVQLNANPGTAQNPHLAFGGAYLFVVWEDSGPGHWEVNVRSSDGSTWSSETCLTSDAVSSRSPVIAGAPNDAMVVWQEGGTKSSIRGKFWSGGAWGSTEIISQSSGSAAEPAVASTGDEDSWYFPIAWSDTRDGESEIYLRTRQYLGYPPSWTWSTETRLTNMTGSCRYPSLHAEKCCGDVVASIPVVAFENNSSGVVESWTVSQYNPATPVRVSAADGVASRRPNLHGFEHYHHDNCNEGGYDARYFVTWSDETSPASRTNMLAYLDYRGALLGSDVLSTVGMGGSVVTAFDGEPRADLMTLWVQEQMGQSNLMSRRGSVVGCSQVEFVPPASILLAPQGIPMDTVRVVDACTGNLVTSYSWFGVNLSFTPALNAALTWDPLPPHPHPPRLPLGTDAFIIESVRGGGCSQAGDVYAVCNGVVNAWVHGAKSPDVNGDCRVMADDLAYVRSKAGTADFCADLNGSGVVDSADVDIVLMTLGDICSSLTAVPGSPDGRPGAEHNPPRAIGLTLAPNPCRDMVAIRCDLPSAGPAAVRIVDAGGRLVRDLQNVQATVGLRTLVWNTRDARDRRVPAGIYFVDVRAGGLSARRSLLVVR